MIVLSLRHIGFSYSAKPVLHDINLDFQKGCLYSILGPNGCGKTTLLDLMIRHRTPQSGHIRLMGRELSGLSRKTMARSIALVSQNATVQFPFTVSEVIMMGRHPYISRFSRPGKADLRQVDRIMDLTGMDLLRDRAVTTLSGGEQQRCLLARALCQETPVLLLDEAFSNLDIGHSLYLLSVIRKEARTSSRTVISVSHDINMAAAWSDELIFLKQGVVAASGNTREVLTEAVIKQTFHVETRIEYNAYTQARQAWFKGDLHGQN